MKEKKILSKTELKAVLQDTLSFDEYLTLYKKVFGKDFPETISNSWGFPPIGEIRNAIISKKPIKVRKKDLLRKGIVL